ncbi:hypothetical protein OG856_41105 [Streptomyces sp. NBC_01594]
MPCPAPGARHDPPDGPRTGHAGASCAPGATSRRDHPTEDQRRPDGARDGRRRSRGTRSAPDQGTRLRRPASNNVLAFPGIFAGALRVRASRITPGMKIAAADALASLIAEELRPDHIIPSPFDPRVAPAVAEAVTEAARRDGVARV